MKTLKLLIKASFFNKINDCHCQPSVGRSEHLDIRAPDEIRTDRTDHFIESIPTQRRCAVCGVKVKKQCSKCNVGLYLDACFATFHRI